MRFDLENLPSDIDLLHRLVREMATAVETREQEIERLRSIIKKLQRAQFGRRSERLDPDQFELALEEIEGDIGHIREEHPAPAAEPEKRRPKRKPLPAHLPREDQILDLPDTVCPCCGGPLHSIGESVSEMLDWVPARFRVLRIRRPKYACRTCNNAVQIPAPERLIAGGLATPALIAQVLVSKYCDHTPLYRQAQIYDRLGLDLDRSTLAGWVGGACWWLESLHTRLKTSVLSSSLLFADDTPVPVLDPGRGRTKTGRFWVYTRDQRGWAGKDPPASVYLFEPDRKAKRPQTHLADFKGVLQVDGYAGFETLTARKEVTLAACWSHTRRYFYDVAKSTESPIALEALRRISELYAIEKKVRGHPPPHRLAVRQQESKPLILELRLWLDTQLPLVPAQSPLADAIRYALARWPALTRFLDDGRIELDTNPVERAIRPVALGRKNHLFAGSEGGGGRWAILGSLIETCKMNDVEPYAYLADILTRMLNGHPVNRLDKLLPWAWKAAQNVNT
ncbi:IS66 family transposase [Magnetospirillum molischianum]|uniref:Putative transposase IS66 family n=3 Tax=Magnetospirillum molischianum TaxID=1083 RepID=H8FWU0_MAGML|nr:IS66 family transposase [Magnetospirillum molischianum]CCG42828.1 putative transposase IS66 family [Magnetospirillum molischianum DSM 120]